jgi:hypothetical protein
MEQGNGCAVRLVTCLQMLSLILHEDEFVDFMHLGVRRSGHDSPKIYCVGA